MNIATFVNGGNVFVLCDRINGVAFKIAGLWDNCAILLPHICAAFARLEDSYAIFHNRTECLSPYGYAA